MTNDNIFTLVNGYKFFSCLILLAVWFCISLLADTPLISDPIKIAREFCLLIFEWESWRQFLITLFRGGLGIILAVMAAFLLGIPCGFFRLLRALTEPIIVVLQSSPTIIWVSLLLVWVGGGTEICVTAVFVAIFPVLFVNIAQGVAGIDVKLLHMAKLYKVSRYRMFRELVIPAISSHLAAALSYALGVSWKVVTTAEFIGASDGVGSRVFWAYRNLNIERLFCWAFVVICLGIFVDVVMVTPLYRFRKSN